VLTDYTGPSQTIPHSSYSHSPHHPLSGSSPSLVITQLRSVRTPLNITSLDAGFDPMDYASSVCWSGFILDSRTPISASG
jgi:hypothetical protein